MYYVGTTRLVELIEVDDDDHRLNKTLENGVLVKAIDRVLELNKKINL
jgi:hypothetical protein